MLEKFNETRTIRIRGKTVDNLDMEKLGNFIQQATQKSSRFNFKGFFKDLKWDIKTSPRKTREKKLAHYDVGI